MANEFRTFRTKETKPRRDEESRRSCASSWEFNKLSSNTTRRGRATVAVLPRSLHHSRSTLQSSFRRNHCNNLELDVAMHSSMFLTRPRADQDFISTVCLSISQVKLLPLTTLFSLDPQPSEDQGPRLKAFVQDGSIDMRVKGRM